MPRPLPSFRSPFTAPALRSLLLLIALGHALLALLAMREKSTTADELGHITGGYTFNHWNDFRLHPENGLLPQRWQALPTTLAGAHYPALTEKDWADSDVWMTGYRFFYRLGNNHEWMLFTARAMNTLFGAATVLLVAAWARFLFGWAGALVAALFCALCPTMLAHSALATSDMAMTLFLLAAVSAYWWHLHDARTGILLLSLITFGLACVAKYTAVLLLPLFLVMAFIRSMNSSPLRLTGRTFTTFASRTGAIAASMIAHGLVAALIIWAFSGFRYSAFNPSLPPGEFNLPWNFVLSFGGVKAGVIDFCRTWRLLPEGWLYGLAFVLKLSDARGAFLDGSYSIFGWVSFFPKAFLYKTPLSLLVALALSGTWLIGRSRTFSRGKIIGALYRITPLLGLFTIYWAFSLLSHLNIGHRHILPTYPVLYIFCGLLGWAATQAWPHSRHHRFALAGTAILLIGWHATIAVRIYPHYLAYFSPLANGPANGYRHLVDSSLDWGQDLPGLKVWLDSHHRPGEPVYLSYFGTGEPEYYGIKAEHMPMIPPFGRPRPWYKPQPGLYAISATMLQNVYLPDRGEWTLAKEKEYQEGRAKEPLFREYWANKNVRDELAGLNMALGFEKTWQRYDDLRFARLTTYLRARQADAMIGYSILIYRLDQAELDAVLQGNLQQFADALERVVQPTP